MTAATTLAGRLFHASRLAYAITAQGALAASADALAAGFMQPAAAVVQGPDGIDAACVTRSADGLVVTFRGTLPPDSPNHRQTAEDWMNDLEALLVPATSLPGLVHAGFLASLDRLWPDLRAAIAAERARAPAATVLVTGHSKGGALAHLGACRLARELGLSPQAVCVCTFAAPHVGNAAFRDAYAGAVRSITRYEYADDLVPHVPLSLAMRKAFADVPLFGGLPPDLDYADVGDLRFIDWAGRVVGDTPLLRADRTLHLIRLLGEMGYDRIVLDHSLADGSGYFNALAAPALPAASQDIRP